MKFCEEVKFVRTKLMITQKELAKNIGVSSVSVARWESQNVMPRAVQYGKFLQFCEQNNIFLGKNK
jgi:predicted transcriptional regulator